jgi:hypothetical protein
MQMSESNHTDHQPDPYHTLNKLSEAVDALATGSGRIQERVLEAALILFQIGADKMPEDLRRDLVRIIDDLIREDPNGTEGRSTATLGTIDDEHARVIARRILGLECKLDRALS